MLTDVLGAVVENARAGIWKYASRESGVCVTPQVLREWFCDEMEG